MDVEAEIKQEVVSPLPSASFHLEDDSKNLDVLDKWRTRVLYCQTSSPLGNGQETRWAKRIERQMAVLRVAFPFLTERQIRGKAWKSCGLDSVMGEVPRNGLSPKVKKEFTKHRSTPIKSRIKKEIKMEKDKTVECPYVFSSPNAQSLTLRDNIKNLKGLIPNSVVPNPVNILNFNDSQMSGIRTLSASNGGSSRKNRKRKRENFESRTNLANQSSTVIPETPDISFNENATSTSPYCSITLLKSRKSKNVTGLHTIIPSINTRNNYVTQSKISSTSTSPSNASKTISDFDKFSQVINPFSQKVRSIPYQPEDIRTSKHNILPIIINNKVNELQDKINSPSEENFRVLQNDSDATLSGLIVLDSCGITVDNLNLNNNDIALGEVTPTKSFKNSEVRKKIVFETLAEIHHSDNDSTRQDISLNNPELMNSKDKFTLDNTVVIGQSNEDSPQNLTEFVHNLIETPLKPTNLLIHPQEAITSKAKVTDQPNSMEVNYSNSVITPVTSLTGSSFSLCVSDEAVPNDVEISNPEFQGNNSINRIRYLNQMFEKTFNQDMEINVEKSFSPNLCVSLPLTPKDDEKCKSLPSNILLSNYCSEYDKAYSKMNLKPIPFRNYYSEQINPQLKHDFDKVIPPKDSLKTFFEASDKSFEQVQTDAQESVNQILITLEEKESCHNC